MYDKHVYFRCPRMLVLCILLLLKGIAAINIQAMHMHIGVHKHARLLYLTGVTKYTCVIR